MRLAPQDQRLKGDQSEQFRAALLDAYDLQRFDEMLRYQLDRQREHIALGNDLQAIIFRVIERAEDEGWTAQLLQGARASRPENVKLLVFAQQFGLAPATPPRLELERKIRDANSTLDVVRWRTHLAEAETKICRVEVEAAGTVEFGTGFLLGPDLVITNYHVLERVINGEIGPESVALRFDYKMLADGRTLNPGTLYYLDEQDWLLDQSPYSPLDFKDSTAAGDPDPAQLDYIVVRVAGSPGKERVRLGDQTDPNAPPRGWFELPKTPYTFAPNTALHILQHPQGEALKLALDIDAVISTNGNKTRVRYRTNTEKGSSGSPCFDANWQLIALHHSGDPNYDKLHKPEYNQGIPIAAIRDLLNGRDKLSLLGEQEE
jgi:hypothetical protein